MSLLVRMTLVALAGTLSLAATRRAAASLRFAIAFLTLGAMLLVPALMRIGPRWTLPLLDRAPVVVGASEPNVSTSPVQTRSVPQRRIPDARLWMVLIAAAGLVRLAFGAFATRRAVAAGHAVTDPRLRDAFARAGAQARFHREVTLVESERVAVPAVWGFRRFVILLPPCAREWPAERLEAVLAHELAHCARGDVAALLFVRAANALLWFHPLAWTLAMSARAACERACDDRVLARGTNAADYAEHLVAIARLARGRMENVAAILWRRSDLEPRLAAVLRDGVPRHAMTRRKWMLSALTAALIALPVAAVTMIAPHEPWTPPAVLYDRAAKQARGGAREAALATLTRAVYAGYLDTPHMLQDEDMASLRGPALDSLATLQDQLVLSDAGGWPAAVQRYDAFAAAHPDIPRARSNLAFALIRNGQERRAIDVLTGLLDAGYDPGKTMYNLACAYARLGEGDVALDWLHRARDIGFDVGNRARLDPDLDTVRADAWLAGQIAGVER